MQPRTASTLRGVFLGAGALVVLSLGKFAVSQSLSLALLMNLPAVLIAAWYGGLWAGAVITAVAALSSYLVSGVSVYGPATTQLGMLMFAVEALGLSWLAARLSRERCKVEQAANLTREANAKLEAIVQTLNDGITLQDSAGKIVFANERAARLTHFPSVRAMMDASPAQLLRHFRLFEPDGSPLDWERLPGRVLLAGGKPAEVLVGFKSSDSEEMRWALVNANGAFDEAGKLQFIVNLFRDVTERHRQEIELQVSREWFSTALRSIGDAVIATDATGKISFLNPVAEALTGWKSQQAQERPLTEVFRVLDEQSRQPLPSPVERVLGQGTVVSLENPTILVRRDGGELHIDDSAAPIRDRSGALLGVVLVFRDVSDQRRAADRREFLARASVELNSSLDYSETLRTVATLAVPKIADWCAVDVVENGELRRLAIAHVEESKLRYVAELQQRYPEDPNRDRGTPNILRTGRAEMIEAISPEVLESVAQDAEHLELIQKLALRSYIGVPMSRNGETFGVISFVMAESGRTYVQADLELASALADRAAIAVENARLYKATESAKTDAELANRTKDEFLAMLGHELRNPLAPIVTALEVMKRKAPDVLERERAMIERQVRHVVRLVDDLLDVSRIISGRIRLATERVDVSNAVERALELAGPLLDERRHHLTVEVSPHLAVRGDSVRLVQIVTNLLTNAAKYTEPAGHIRIRAEAHGSMACIDVQDDGVGIAPEMLPRVFGLFVQAPQTIDRARGGLGLGLPIVQGLVRAFGGTVSVQSEGLGRGSKFRVELPLYESGSKHPSTPPAPALELAQAKRVLIVDDNTDALEVMAEALSLLGYRAHPASNAHQALELAQRVSPDLALLDIGLPGLDGYELGKRLRALPGLQSLKLVALTGYGQASDRARSQSAGFAAHLVKPVELAVIEKLLKELSAPPRADVTTALN